METTQVQKSSGLSLALLAIIIAACCFALGYIDHETKRFSDLLTAQNLFALFIYFLPTFFVCGFLKVYFLKKHSMLRSLALSLAIGVPLTFTLVIILLLMVRRLQH